MTQSIYLTKVLYLAYNLAIAILILTDHQKYVGKVLYTLKMKKECEYLQLKL